MEVFPPQLSVKTNVVPFGGGGGGGAEILTKGPLPIPHLLHSLSSRRMRFSAS